MPAAKHRPHDSVALLQRSCRRAYSFGVSVSVEKWVLAGDGRDGQEATYKSLI